MALRQNPQVPTDDKSTEKTTFDVPTMVKPELLHDGCSLLDKESLPPPTQIFNTSYYSKQKFPIPYSLTATSPKSFYLHYNHGKDDSGKSVPAILGKGGTATVKVAQKFERGAEDKEYSAKDFDLVKTVKSENVNEAKENFNNALGEAEVWQKLYPTAGYGSLYITTSAKTGLNKYKIFMKQEKGKELFDHVLNDTLYQDAENLLELCFNITKQVELLFNLGFLHRDIKMENIMLDIVTKIVKLIDFGFAIRKDEIHRPCNKVLCGTLVSAAPELFCKSKDRVFSEPTEVYALGIVLKTVLFGLARKYDKESNNIEIGYYNKTCTNDVQNKVVIVKNDNTGNTYTIDFEILELTNKMIDDNPKKRPTLKEVAETFEKALIAVRKKKLLSAEPEVVSVDLSESKEETASNPTVVSSCKSALFQPAAPTLVDLLSQAIPVIRIMDKSDPAKEDSLKYYLVFNNEENYNTVLRELRNKGLLENSDFECMGSKIDKNLELKDRYILEVKGKIKIYDGKVVLLDAPQNSVKPL